MKVKKQQKPNKEPNKTKEDKIKIYKSNYAQYIYMWMGNIEYEGDNLMLVDE